jgi:Sec-independent protein translocase protein TatA
MILTLGFLLFLGLIVFGPKKTIEIAQEAGRVLAQVKHAAAHLQRSVLEPEDPVRTGSVKSGSALRRIVDESGFSASKSAQLMPPV